NLKEKKERQIIDFIIGSIDDDGYLRRDLDALKDDLYFKLNINVNINEIKIILNKIQEFDPPGVAARDLQECLLIQLKKRDAKNLDNASHELDQLAIKVLEKYFNEFTKKHFSKIQKGLSLSDEKLKEIIDVIVKLNPKPGAIFSHSGQMEQYIIPDFYVYNDSGVLNIVLNQKNAPELRVNSYYREMFKDFNKGTKNDKNHKETVMFVKQKIDSAKWFIDAIKQRQKTLEETMTRIVQFQESFFLTGDESNLKPMVLRDIAERVALDISTVSRVVNSKYVQTEFGTFSLKHFFSESITTDSGDEVSTREVKKILSDIINDENKKSPYADEKLMELLKEKGYNIARRTVTKYREQLNIPVARMRKEV
ncbi:MAG: RNA polymerase factor sigma-54, partial [Chitinophagaceae bacterium]|nr:RNA polymerase factor sigma-54 [Chitinophagaceae bacterium]